METVWTDDRFPGVSCRRATPQDLPALLGLKTQRQQDYMAQVLPRWIADHPGGVYAYYFDGQLCGLASIHLPAPDEAWLRGKRIALGFEGKGIGTATAIFEMEEARRLGARVARLVSAAGNEAVHHMMRDKLGFHDVAHWWLADDAGPAGDVLDLGESASPSRPNGAPRLTSLGPLLDFHGSVAGGSEAGPGTSRWGLMATDDEVITLRTLDDRVLSAQGQLLTTGPAERPDGAARVDLAAETAFVKLFVATSGEAAERLRRAVREVAGRRRLKISLPVAEASSLLGGEDALERYPGRTFIVYEQGL